MMHAMPQEPRSVFQPIDLDSLEANLETLMKCYRDALRFVERLPRLGRVRVEYLNEKRNGTPHNWITNGINRLAKPSNRWVARSLTRLFLEAHIRSKLEEIIRFLRIEGALEIKESETNKRAKRIKSLIAPLDELQKALFSWKQRGAIFARLPFLPVVIALATPFLASYTGIDFSSTKDVAKSVLARTQAGGLTRSIVLAAILLGELYMLLAPLVTSLGFRIKRAILAGGTTEWRLFDDPEYIRWLEFPTINAYQIENQVFTTIDIPKPREFPLDFVLAFLPFYIFLSTVLYSTVAINQVFGGEALTGWDALGISALWIVLIGLSFHGWKNYRRRREERNL